MLLNHTTVSIIGLGLMGGSLALALRGHCGTIVGHDRDPETVRRALEGGVIDRGSSELAAAVAGAELVVLAVPVGAILALLPAVAVAHPGPLHLIDLGSSKAAIVARMAKLPAHVSPLGGHPLCGKELAGLDSADAALFR